MRLSKPNCSRLRPRRDLLYHFPRFFPRLSSGRGLPLIQAQHSRTVPLLPVSPGQANGQLDARLPPLHPRAHWLLSAPVRRQWLARAHVLLARVIRDRSWQKRAQRLRYCARRFRRAVTIGQHCATCNHDVRQRRSRWCRKEGSYYVDTVFRLCRCTRNLKSERVALRFRIYVIRTHCVTGPVLENTPAHSPIAYISMKEI